MSQWNQKWTPLDRDEIGEPTADVPQDFIEGMRDIAAGRVVDLDTALTKPFPPTADVEKIARKVGLELIGKSGSEVEAILAKYLAQVSAPLVEAIDVAIALLDQCKDISARKVLNAVLTGTEENVSKQERKNETTNSSSTGGNPTT